MSPVGGIPVTFVASILPRGPVPPGTGGRGGVVW